MTELSEVRVCKGDTAAILTSSTTFSQNSSSPTASVSSSISSADELIENQEKSNMADNRPIVAASSGLSSEPKRTSSVKEMNINDSRVKILSPKMDPTSVRVAVRIRPQSLKERNEMCKICTFVTPREPQITLGHKEDKSFTFDYVYDIESNQSSVFESSVKFLVDGCLEGYNATVLAYGQTGSGKTYTMGTSFDSSTREEGEGILPRAITYLFEKIDQKTSEMRANCLEAPEFTVNAQFIELYNEEVIDLLENLTQITDSVNECMSLTPAFNTNRTSKIEIHEDQFGGIYINGCTNINVGTVHETLSLLRNGAKVRSTGSTNMNSVSSRSHAIFTLTIKQKYPVSQNGEKKPSQTTTPTTNEFQSFYEENDFQMLSAKFHFVDLAGSERLKRTGATGNRAKEGICINRGLLALGNVISALGDREKVGCHVPYRDSKLTRLLQDSLGGNSRTLMIACVSPSDRDFMETLNTLRYANRARNIKNKVFVNQDKTSKQIAQLKAEIERLNYELTQYKLKSNEVNMNESTMAENSASTEHNNNNNSDESTSEFLFMINKLRQENILLLSDNQNLRTRSKASQEALEKIKQRNCDLQLCNQKLRKLLPNFGKVEAEEEGEEKGLSNDDSRRYIEQIEELRCKLVESEIMCKFLKQKIQQVDSNDEKNSPITLNHEYDNNSMNSLSLNQYISNDAKASVDINSARNLILSDDYYDEGMTKCSSSEANASSSDCLMREDEAKSSGESIAPISSLPPSESQQRLQIEISNLGVEIDLKKRLINELETNNKNLEKMKSYYEGKLAMLHNRIRQIEDEREKMIFNMSQVNEDNKLDEQIKKVRVDYEVKLQSLQADLSKYQQIKNKNAEMLKNAVENERQLQQLNKDVLEMKKLKVKLMNQLKEESLRFKKEEQKRMREIATLKRDHLKKDNQIKFLEAEKRCKEIVLKRKQEQLQALKRNTTRLSEKALGKSVHRSTPAPSVASNASSMNNNLNKTNVMTSSINRSQNPSEINGFSRKKTFYSKSFQLKWQKLDEIIHAFIVKKQTISLIEREMERFLEQREKISHKLNHLLNRLERKLAQSEQKGVEWSNEALIASDPKLKELKDRIDVMKSNIDYLQEQIAECQTNIIQLDELKDGTDFLNIENFIETITSIHEAKYFLKKLMILALNKGIIAAQKEFLSNELKFELEQCERDYHTQQDLLQNIINADPNSNNAAPNKQQTNNFNNYFHSQNNAGHISSSDNFEIDEIILAPQLDVSTTDSEDGFGEFEKIVDEDSDDSPAPPPLPVSKEHKEKSSSQNLDDECLDNSSSNLFNSSQSASLNGSDSAVKVRQVIASGPHDLLYISKNSLEKPDKRPRNTETSNLNTTNNNNNNNNSSQNVSINNLSSISNLINNQSNLVQTSRICSKSYTKISEMVNNCPNITNVVIEPAAAAVVVVVKPTPAVKERRLSNANLVNESTEVHKQLRASNSNVSANLPMSRSAIVTSSDASNYKRMTRSSISRQNSKDSCASTSPSRSPVNYSSRKFFLRDENVFNRLTYESKQSPMPERGIIKTYSGNTNRFRSFPLTLTHVAEGHSKAVLSIDSNDFKLFTGSKDRTAKVWDLITGQEISALAGHFNNVTKVRYCKSNQLCFTVSGSYVRIWDLRESPTKCVKSICSSGIVYDGNVSLNTIKSSSKMIQNESSAPPGEQAINDLAIDDTGSLLYLAAGNSIKIWDLKQFSEMAKLSGGANSSIMTVLAKNNQIIVGSKDHYIKVFELTSSQNSTSFQLFNNNNNNNINNLNNYENTNYSVENNLINGITVTKFNMMPPHYDGVQTLCRIGDSLYSGSRDMCIKKWSMVDHQCKQSINNAHKDWICSLDYMNDYNYKILLSGCRGGYLKLWNAESCEKIADFKAHLCPINAIKVNNNMVFTASDDATVRIWRKDK